MKPTRDELEFLISQHLDGTLNPLEQAMLDEALATDAGARAILSDYQQLNTLVKSATMPQIAWDDFAARVNAETAKLDAPVKHYTLKFGTGKFGMGSRVAALAAMVAIAFGIVAKFRTQPGSTTVDHGASVALNPAPIEVQISAPPILASAPVTEIAITQPSGLATAEFHSAESIISRPSSINWIASGTASGQDSDPSMY